MSDIHYRELLASHFNVLTRISRDEIFGDADSKYRPINLPDDHATMFAGYVGRSYMPGQGLLLLAINPGGGGDDYTSRSKEDEIFYPHLIAFKTAQESDVFSAFEAMNDAFIPIVKDWNLWRILKPTLNAADASLNQVAYMNVVPYRTRNNKTPPVAAQRTAWSKIVQPSIELLDPMAIITLGKKAGSIVDTLLDSDIRTYCVPRTNGDTYVSEGASLAHSKIREELGARQKR